MTEMEKVIAETVHELEKKFDAIYEKKLAQVRKESADSLQKCLVRMNKLAVVVEAAAYCYHNKHIDPAAVVYSGLDAALEALEKKEPTHNPPGLE